MSLRFRARGTRARSGAGGKRPSAEWSKSSETPIGQHLSVIDPNGKGWFSNTSFTTGLKTLPTFRPDALVFFRAKKTRASGRNVGKVFNPVVKLVLENQPFLMPEPAEKPSLHRSQRLGKERQQISLPTRTCVIARLPVVVSNF